MDAIPGVSKYCVLFLRGSVLIALLCTMAVSKTKAEDTWTGQGTYEQPFAFTRSWRTGETFFMARGQTLHSLENPATNAQVSTNKQIEFTYQSIWRNGVLCRARISGNAQVLMQVSGPGIPWTSALAKDSTVITSVHNPDAHDFVETVTEKFISHANQHFNPTRGSLFCTVDNLAKTELPGFVPRRVEAEVSFDFKQPVGQLGDWNCAITAIEQVVAPQVQESQLVGELHTGDFGQNQGGGNDGGGYDGGSYDGGGYDGGGYDEDPMEGRGTEIKFVGGPYPRGLIGQKLDFSLRLTDAFDLIQFIQRHSIDVYGISFESWSAEYIFEFHPTL